MRRNQPLAMAIMSATVLSACGGAAQPTSPLVTPSAEAPTPRSASAAGTGAPTPSAQPTLASTPSPQLPTTAPDVGLGFLPPGSEARVTVDAGLRLRETPGTGSAILATLAKGTVVEMFGPPWQRDVGHGFEWRRVLVRSADDAQVGWVATVGPGTFLAVEPIDCPAGPVDLQTVMRMTAWARLTCLSGREVTVEGRWWLAAWVA